MLVLGTFFVEILTSSQKTKNTAENTQYYHLCFPTPVLPGSGLTAERSRVWQKPSQQKAPQYLFFIIVLRKNGFFTPML